MAGKNICISCGATNTHFASKCDFCNAPLKISSNDEITNEELISSINFWIGNFISDGARKIEYKGVTKQYFSGDMDAIINKYLSLLQLRAIEDSRLLSFYNDLTQKYILKKKQKNMEMYIAMIFCFVAIIGILLFVFFMEINKK